MASKKLTNVVVVLIRDCIGDPYSEKRFENQTIRLQPEEKHTQKGVDGHSSFWSTPSKVLWFGYRKSELKGITQVSIIEADGGFIAHGDLGWNQSPQDVDDGVQFEIISEGA